MSAAGGTRPERPSARRDALLAPYLLLLGMGTFSFLVILLAFGQLIAGTAPWTHVTTRAPVHGVYRYDAHSGQTLEGARTSFKQGQSFAARVDWSALPSSLEVGARWYDDNGEDWGGIQPATASALAASPHHALVPMVRTDAPPGNYTVDVMRYAAGRPVQILGRAEVVITP